MARTRVIQTVVPAVLLLACFSAAPALARTKHPPLKVSYVEAQGVVKPGLTDGFGLHCPKSTPRAIGGYFGSTNTDASGPLVAVTASFPFGKKDRSWSIAVRDLSSEPQDYYAGAICVSGGPYKDVVDSGTVDPNGQNGVDETCPRSMPKALAGYFAPQSDDTGQLSLAASNPIGTREWTISVKNNTDQAQPFIVGAICAPARAKVHFLSSDARPVQPGASDYASGTCPSKFPHPVGGWFGIPKGDEFGNFAVIGSSYLGSRKNPRKWEVGVANQVTDAHSWFAGITCMGG